MTISTQDAIAESGDILRTLAATSWPSFVVRWEGMESNDSPPSDNSWFHWTMDEVVGEQGSLSCEHG